MQSGSTPQTEDYFHDLSVPDINDQKIQLQQLVEAGVLSPEEAQAELAGRSEMNNIQTDPQYKKAQMDALLGLQDISGNGGLTAMDKQQLAQIQNQENTSARGSREAILQNAQSRGMGGSGLELMAQLQNAQDSATRASSRDLGVAANAQQRALDALIQGGQLGGQMQAQDFGQQAQVAGANDAIAKFNAANKQNVNLTNVQAANQAQAANLANKQNVMNQNVGLRNQQEQANKALIQQNFENQLKKRSGQAGIAQNNAAAAGQNSQNAANANNQTIGTGLAVGASLFGGPAAGVATKKVYDSQTEGKKDGGLIEGEPADYDSQLTPTMAGEVIIKKDDVPEAMRKIHTKDDGDFDVAGFLDMMTGGKYSYSKKKKGA